MQQAKTVTPKSAKQLLNEINAAILSYKVPVVIADQPALSVMVANHGGHAANAKTSDADIMRSLGSAVKSMHEDKRCGVVVIKKVKGQAAGQFPGSHFVKIIADRVYINIGSVAALLVEGE